VYDTEVQCQYIYEPRIEYMDPIAFAARSDQDIMFYHEILHEPDRHEFIKAMQIEITAMNEAKHWNLGLRSTLPPGTAILPTVWAMRRKRRLTTGEVYKWKDRINVDGSKQENGGNYWTTYAPVATWASIHLILCMASINGWSTMTLEFVQAYPQAPAEITMYGSIRHGCDISPQDPSLWCLQIINNVYGQKQAGKVWNDFLIAGLKSLGFHQSTWDNCVLWKDQYILIIYTDDTNITGPDPL
jgi:Reverse transcriptase (RNA-dependent DNA polymerase)